MTLNRLVILAVVAALLTTLVIRMQTDKSMGPGGRRGPHITVHPLPAAD